ncbi:MAG: hypothetical protein ABWY58_02165 [Aeromicrobium sp.]
MKRHALTAAAVAVVLSVSLAACSGGGSDDKPKASPSKTPSAAPATTSAAPPQPPAQPTGAYGVTYEIQNWDQYATDPAVLAWKQTLEAVGGSVNSGKLAEPVRTGMSKKVLRDYVSSLEQARSGNWHVESVGKVRVESAENSASRSTLTTCSWAPSTVYLTKDGKSPDGDENFDVWLKNTYDLALRDGRWMITSSKSEGKCPGGPPA